MLDNSHLVAMYQPLSAVFYLRAFYFLLFSVLSSLLIAILYLLIHLCYQLFGKHCLGICETSCSKRTIQNHFNSEVAQVKCF